MWLVVNVLVALPAFIVQWRSSAASGGEAASLMAATFYAALVRIISTVVVAAVLWSTSRGLAEWLWQQPQLDPSDAMAPTAITFSGWCSPASECI
jgi:hypothetical protein